MIRNVLTAMILSALFWASDMIDARAEDITQEITESESGLIFNPAELQGGYRRFIKSENESGDISISATYGPPQDLLPRAAIVLDKAGPHRYVSEKLQWEQLRDGFNFTQGKNLKLSKPQKARSGIGTIDFVVAESTDLSCIIFQQYFGARGRSAGYGDKRILGHYCDKIGAKLNKDTAERLLASIGHAEYGLPAGVTQASLESVSSFPGKLYKGSLSWTGNLALSDAKFYVTGTKTGDFVRFLTADKDLCEGEFKPGEKWWLLCDTGLYVEGTRQVKADGSLELTGTDQQKNPVSILLKPAS